MGLLKLLSAFHSWSNSRIAKRFPRISLYYYTRPKAWLARRRHPLHALLKGQSLSSSSKPSCLFFTVHKSATSFMSSYLGEVAANAGLVFVDYALYFHGQGQEGLKKQATLAQRPGVFNKRGYFYGPLRYFLPVPELSAYNIVLFVRDPRDILTSQYFSIRNSHPQVTRRMIERRAAAQRMRIDEHVRAEAPRFVKTFETYSRELLGKKNVLLLRYEDMIRNFPEFLRKLNAHCGLELDASTLQKLDRSAEFNVASENPDQHKRKVAAGDHKEKLQPETIAWLNEQFAGVLKDFGYDL